MPKNSTRRTSSAPSGAIPTLERSPKGGLSTTPPRMSTPLGRPDAAKKSPLTPTIVAVEESRRCIEVTRSVPWIDSFESTGLQRVEAGRARAADDVERDGPVRRELDAALVGDAGHERRRLRRCRGGEDQGEKPPDEEFAQHDPDGG